MQTNGREEEHGRGFEFQEVSVMTTQLKRACKQMGGKRNMAEVSSFKRFQLWRLSLKELANKWEGRGTWQRFQVSGGFIYDDSA